MSEIKIISEHTQFVPKEYEHILGCRNRILVKVYLNDDNTIRILAQTLCGGFESRIREWFSYESLEEAKRYWQL
jgi:FAD/FMN-containing dehydrogenase